MKSLLKGFKSTIILFFFREKMDGNIFLHILYVKRQSLLKTDPSPFGKELFGYASVCVYSGGGRYKVFSYVSYTVSI